MQKDFRRICQVKYNVHTVEENRGRHSLRSLPSHQSGFKSILTVSNVTTAIDVKEEESSSEIRVRSGVHVGLDDVDGIDGADDGRARPLTTIDSDLCCS